MAEEPSRLRILQVASSLCDWGGIERYVLYAIQGLTGQGHHLTLAVSRDSPLGLRANCRQEDISTRRRFDAKAIARYLRFFRANRFDAVHLHFTPDLSVAALAARLAHQPNIVLTRHSAEPWGRGKARFYNRLLDRVIPVSEAAKESLVGAGFPAEKLMVAKAGCPAPVGTERREEVRSRFGLTGFVFGYFGRLVEEKGVDIAIRASAKSGAVLLVVGGGPEDSNYRCLASDLLAPVVFTGRVDEVGDLMGAVDAVVVPSRWAEAFPFVTLEAMALAKPVVASKVGGLPEQIQNGINGLLFTTTDVDDLCRCMEALLSDAELANRMAATGRRGYESTYTVGAMAQRLEKALIFS